MTDPDKENVSQLPQAGEQQPEQEFDPNKPWMFAVEPGLMEDVMELIGELPGKQCFKTLTRLTQCQKFQVNAPNG